ncbi:hypothetical protein [Rhodococcus spongiicola]|uniref:hypothetical protein n=1 Tax=Rhodococcus spongiicola TaxID=2487352 RepID=UPI0013E314DC|nr:hypothetical protein [Rhodococcus spongiicola]
MIKSVRAAVTAALAAPLLAVAFAAPANAAAEDVNLTADVQGNDVWVTITNDNPSLIGCEWLAWAGDDVDDEPQVLVRTLVLPLGGESRTAADLPDGDYKISWWCTTIPASDEEWGTGDIGGGGDTADPTPVTTPVPVDDEGTDTGSLGSLGSSESGSLGSLGSSESGSTDSGSTTSGSTTSGSTTSPSLGDS